MAKSTKRVLVFGPEGSGKTSMINTLLDKEHTPAHPHEFSTISEYPGVEYNNITWFFVDVGDLSYETKDSMADLKKYTTTTGPFDILVMVMRAGRILVQAKSNYTNAKILGRKNTPLLCVATFCENYDPMEKWISDYDIFKAMQTSGMEFTQIVATCFACGGRNAIVYDPLRKMSCKATWGAIFDVVNSVQVVAELEEEQNEISKLHPMQLAKRGWNAFRQSRMVNFILQLSGWVLGFATVCFLVFYRKFHR